MTMEEAVAESFERYLHEDVDIPSRDAVDKLLGPSPALFTLVCDLVKKQRASSLELLYEAETPLHELVNDEPAFSRRVEFAARLGPPFAKDENVAVHAVRALAAGGLLLLADEPREDHLRALLAWQQEARTSPLSGYWTPELIAGDEPRLRRCLDRLAEVAADQRLTGAVATTAFTLQRLAGHQPYRASQPRSVRVLFAGNERGVSGDLRATLLHGAPAGLVPDPEHMAFFTVDEDFQASLDRAWRVAGQDKVNGAVLWSIKGRGGLVRRVTDESLGAAFTVVIDELARFQRPVFDFWRFRRLVPVNTVVGGVGEDGRLRSVGGYDEKLTAVLDQGKVIVPDDDKSKSAHFSGSVEVVPAKTWQDAARAARARNRRTLFRNGFVAVAALVALITPIAGATYVNAQSEKAGKRVAQLASDAQQLESSDPRLAALLALESHRLDPAAPRPIKVLTDVVQRSAHVVHSSQAHQGGVSAVTQDVSARRTISAGGDGVIRLWDNRTGRMLGAVDAPGPLITRLRFSATTAVLLGADTDGNVKLWQTNGDTRFGGSRPLLDPEHNQEKVVSVGFYRADDARAFAVYDSGRVHAWDVVTGETVADVSLNTLTHTQKQPAVVAATTTYDEDGLVLATSDHTIYSVDLDRRRVRTLLKASELPPGTDSVTALAQQEQPKGLQLAIGTNHGVVLWDVAHNRQVGYPFGALMDQITDVDFSDDAGNGGSTLSIATDREVAFVDVGNPANGGIPAAFARYESGPVNALAAGEATDGRVAVGGQDGRLTILDPANRRLQQEPIRRSTVQAFDQDGRFIYANGSGVANLTDGFSIIRPSDGAAPVGPSGDRDYHVLVSLRPDPMWAGGLRPLFATDAALTRSLAAVAGKAGDQEGAVLVWDARTGKPLHKLDFPSGRGSQAVLTVRFVPKSDVLVARNSDGTVAAWSTRTWKQLFRSTVGLGKGLVVDPRGRFVALPITSGSAPTRRPRTAIALLDVTNQRTRFFRVDGEVRDIAYAPDGRTLAVLTSSNTVRYLTGDGRPQQGSRDLSLPFDALSIGFSPDGRQIAIPDPNGHQTFVYDRRSGTLAMPPLQDSTGFSPLGVLWSPHGDLLTVLTGSAAPQSVNAPGMFQVQQITMFTTKTVSWRTQVCAIAGQDITRQEWARYVKGVRYEALCSGTG